MENKLRRGATGVALYSINVFSPRNVALYTLKEQKGVMAGYFWKMYYIMESLRS
jgi:hypothetical protein